MKKVGIVLLNYLNYKDTIECVNSIYNMEYDITGIVIVDNGSGNDSFKILHRLYRDDKKVIVVKAKKNLGFAKGNNIGIRIARSRLHSDFVFAVNNDVVFTEKDFFIKLLESYEPGTGVIGPEIHLRNDIVQNKFSAYITLREALLLYLKFYLEYREKTIWLKAFPPLEPGKRVPMLHGCALLFTPDFFKYYEGFYPRTFLYNEEAILYIMCKEKNLKQRYTDRTCIYHKEDQSSALSFNNENKTMNRYQLKSYKYLVWWILKDRIQDLLHI